MFQDRSVRCDTPGCRGVYVGWSALRGDVEASARRRGWGCWPGLTIRGEPAPEHLCPTCCTSFGPSPKPRRRGMDILEGQQDLGFDL